MLGLALTLTSLASTWTYAGFVANPHAPPRVTPSTPPAPPGPPAPPAAPPTPPPWTVIRYRMADATGQVWEHPDPTILQAFVLERNARIVRPQPVIRRFAFRR